MILKQFASCFRQKKIFLLLLFVELLCNNIFAQHTSAVKGRVVNDFTKEPVAFASVFWKKAAFGSTTDTAGNFILNRSRFNVDTLVVSYVGFEKLLFPFSNNNDTTALILFFREAKLHDGIEVKSKFSKGLRWWKQIVAHKAKNTPYRFDNYSYELYNKLEVDITNINKHSFEDKKMLKPFSFLLKNIDSTSEAKPFLPVFLTEALSNYYYSTSPYKVKEEIKAYITNGIKNETVMHFIGGVDQKINLYNDYVSLFGKEFISPLSSIGDRFYNYKGADTQTINQQKFYHLFFSPKQEGSNTFKGDCWIHGKTWAIQKINITASETANINYVNRLSVVQEFVQINDSTWMFSKDKFIADLSPFPKNKLSFIGRKTCTYHNVQFNQASTQKILSNNKQKEEVIILENANQASKEFWKDNRHEPLSVNEDKIYGMIDTLKQMPLFKKYSNAATFIVDGHKKLGFIEIGPWYKWLSSNELEKLRTRFDVGTTEKFSQHLRLAGYLAYGFGDERLKGKFGFNYKINKHESWQVASSYTDDLDNGRIRYNDDDDVTVDNAFSRLLRRKSIVQKFIGVKDCKINIGKEWGSNFTTQFSFNRTIYKTYTPLPASNNFSRRLNTDDIITSEFGMKFRYAPGEKRITSRRRSYTLKNTLPVFDIRLAAAAPNIFKSEYTYQKASINISHSFRIPRWGKIDYMAYAGKIWGDKIPFMMLEIHPGNEIYYYNKNSFNLMNRFEYVSDQFAGFNIEHNFEKKLFNLIPFMRKTKMRQFWNIKTVNGDVSLSNRLFNGSEYNYYYLKRLKGKFYTEIGTGIDNIWKFFRIDLVWRLAPTPVRQPPVEPQNFAVFGSFKLQF
jgi:hypothetical protein